MRAMARPLCTRWSPLADPNFRRASALAVAIRRINVRVACLPMTLALHLAVRSATFDPLRICLTMVRHLRAMMQDELGQILDVSDLEVTK